MSYSILPPGDIPRRLSHPRLGNSKSHVSNSFLLSGLIENLAAADKFNIIKSTSLFPFPILQIAKTFFLFTKWNFQVCAERFVEGRGLFVFIGTSTRLIKGNCTLNFFEYRRSALLMISLAFPQRLS